MEEKVIVTIRSIAEAANVSRGTVDKVLNNRPGVSQEVRERVKRIAEEMGYKPNLAGKALAFQKKPLRIGVIILNKDDPLFQEVYEGVKKASHELKGFGITVECCVMGSVNVQEQLMCIRELYSKNISALALSPLDEEIIRNELKKLTEENIKIVTFNTDITGIERVCFVGQDLKKSGRVAGDLIGKLLPDGGNVLVITGPEKIKALQERVAGFKEIIEKEYPAIKIIDVLQNIHDNESSYLQTVEILKRQDSLNAIYITGRGIGGVGRAIRELNRRHIKFVCFDKIPETIELIKDKIVDFTITQEPFMQGYLPIKILFEYFFHNRLPDNEQVYTKLEIRTKENIDI
ncbi:LacI family DNA-binding transcriptional regulator [Petroclostridium xylanilyticum]|jgi:LacI family transcriptional regulator|uniref:LacI family DNA-binding transcriptional regulator n=1 Tax=Petroclostridium xylanilyticum TaxID=1792311 RepID=UPI000B99021E|nr:LacI family DNA-binding transcriptional regulator [Petroclostridium xylanilyticum]